MRKIFMILLMLSTPLLGQSFLPENDLHLEDSFYVSNMSEEDFNEIMYQISTIYVPIVKKFGASLKIQGNWSNSTVNAYAYQEGNTWVVQMFGGLARRPEITRHGFAMVVCHELGHHLGGYPYVSYWAANEGQSDYFSAHVCARKYYEYEGDHVEYLHPTATKKCKDMYTGKDRNTCFHVMSGAESISKLLAYLGNSRASFDTPSTKVVGKTNNSHPDAQCRLDTLVAGILCDKIWNDRVIPSSSTHKSYNCTSGEGARPRCWFAK